MPKHIEQKSPFELEDDADKKIDTDASVEETQHNIGPEIIDARKVKREIKEQEEKALEIKELQEALEVDPLADSTLERLEYEESIDKRFSQQFAQSEKKSATPEDLPHNFWKSIKKYLPF